MISGHAESAIDSDRALRLKRGVTTARRRRVRTIGSLILAALLTVPLVASGHFHAHTAAPCATCAVTQHTPVVSVPIVVIHAATTVVGDVEIAPSIAPVAPSVRRATERGPPPLRALGS